MNPFSNSEPGIGPELNSTDLISTRNSQIKWVESSLLDGIDKTFEKTFSPPGPNVDFQIIWLSRILPHWVKDAGNLPRRKVKDKDDLLSLAQNNDVIQIYCIRQKHSYARLYITRELFENLIDTYNVFDRIWDFVRPFSFKTKESDIGHAPFRFRQSQRLFLGDLQNRKLGSFQCAYGFRYVELNNRDYGGKENPDFDPWSVRQSAIYQQYDSTTDKIMFIMISPSEEARKTLEKAVNQRAATSLLKLNPFDLHRILLSTLFENWRLYIRSLESLIMIQSERVTLAQVQAENVKLSPLTDFEVNFIDRQRLKMIEDKVLDLVIVFESLANTLIGIKRQCEIHCLKERCFDCNCSMISEELGEQIYEAQVNIKKSDILYKRAQGTAQLLSDLLDYENAQIGHLSGQALNGLAKETKEENSKMRVLTERSTADAAAVKILTVITLIYLPMTVVANFFSSQLIRVNSEGQVSVVSGSWWFAVVSVPLTVVTFMVWRWWLRFATRGDSLNAENNADLEKAEDKYQKKTRSRRGWWSAYRFLFALGNLRRP